MLEKVVLEGFQDAPRQDRLDLNVIIHYLYWNIYQVCTANINRYALQILTGVPTCNEVGNLVAVQGIERVIIESKRMET